MKNLFLLALSAALLAPACKIFKSTPKGGRANAEAAPAPAQYASTGDRNVDYVARFKDAAIMEMEQGGIPASIILAQGILESAAGNSDLAQQANNHFGIKCGGGWSGKTFYKKDDDLDKDGNLIESCFRRYESVSDSYHDHGEFLRDPKKHNRYGFLFNLDRTDYKSWARGLQAAGYATAPTYANQLINLIERYKLYEYDRPGSTPISVPNTPGGQPQPTGPGGRPIVNAPTNRIGRVNDVKMVLSRENETLDEIARAYRLNTMKVADYNDRGYSPGVRLRPGTRIFLQHKKDKWRGRANEHFVNEGQTMFDISQLYGIKLDKLLTRNGLNPGQEPAVGEKIYLKGKYKKGRVVRLRDTSNDPSAPSGPAPVVPRPSTMTPNDDELLPEIGGEEPKPQAPNLPPASGGTRPTTPSSPTKPSTTGSNFPPANPSPNPPSGGWNPDNQPPYQPPVPNTPPPSTPLPDGYHLVVKGDTLFNISKRYNITVARLKQLNNMSDDVVRIGQQLRVR
jgi:LysM repeat protein